MPLTLKLKTVTNLWALLMIKSDGGSTAYYDLPKEAKDIGDLIEYRDMSFNVGNIFKACYRIGQKDGTTELYDLEKIVYFAQRELKRAKVAERERQKKVQDTQPSTGGFEEPIKWVPTEEYLREAHRR